MLCVGLGLVGATAIVLIFQNSATAVLIGFAFGASLLALFMRVGGGIFTKAADVGADLVGKVEAGIPEDDPRNAATIADNVGDNVGDCAGMAADLFESYEITIISSLILGYSAFLSIHKNPTPAVLFPLIVPAIGIFASVIGVLAVRARKSDRNALPAINRGFWLAAVLTVIGALLVAQYYVHDLKVFWAVLTGVVLSLVASQITEEFTSTERGPVKEIARSARTGPATTVLSGIYIGLESSVWAIIAIAIAIGVAIGLGDGNIELHLLPGGAHRHRPPRHDGHGGLRGQLRPGVGQRSRHRRDVGRVHRRGRAGHGEPRRRGQHHQGHHQGRRHRLGRHRRSGAVLVLHRDHRLAALQLHPIGASALRQAGGPDQRGQSHDVHRTADRRVDRASSSPRWPSGPSAARPGPSCSRCGASSASTRGSWTTPRSPSTGGSSASARRPPSASWRRRRCWPSWLR